MFSLICVGINGRVNNREAGDLRHYCAHCDVTVMRSCDTSQNKICRVIAAGLLPLSDISQGCLNLTTLSVAHNDPWNFYVKVRKFREIRYDMRLIWTEVVDVELLCMICWHSVVLYWYIACYAQRGKANRFNCMSNLIPHKNVYYVYVVQVTCLYLKGNHPFVQLIL